MESWSYVSEGKGFVSEETISPFNSLARSKNALLGWDLKTTPCDLGNNMLVSSQPAVENQVFVGEYIEMVGKQVPGDSFCGRKITGTTAGIAFSREDDSTSKLSSSVLDSGGRDSLLIDLKLGRIGDRQDVHNSKFTKGPSGFSSSESSTPPKRMRLSGVNSQTAFCQVYGCNKDLSSSKDYHKRHKVCELHSKTAKVLVNGIEQRFCQQCSRFHLLGEFDDGKRSCRKRLAGHNQRRRKPQVGIHSGRAGRMLQSYNDSRFQGTTSFICQDILPSGFFQNEKYGTSDWCRCVKVEDGSDCRPFSTVPATIGHLRSKLLFPLDVGKEFPSFHENGANAVTASIFSDNGSQYTHELGAADSGSRAFFHNIMLGSEDFSSFGTAPAIQGFSGIPDSGCALSLLSSQSQNSPNHLSGFPMARRHTCYGMSQVSEKLVGASLQASTSGVPEKLPSLRMNPVDGGQVGPLMMSSSGDTVNFEITDGMFQGSGFLNSKDRLACEDVPTIDLLQLSSQLQRVENQRQSMQMKPENDAFCCLRIT